MAQKMITLKRGTGKNGGARVARVPKFNNIKWNSRVDSIKVRVEKQQALAHQKALEKKEASKTI